jgi:outer membrane protein OmpA-like peptidoglycan-associated protein
MRLIPHPVIGALACLFTASACSASAKSGAAERAEQRAQEAREEAREARADAEKAQEQAAEEQAEVREAHRSQRDAEQRAQVANQQALQAEAQANEERERAHRAVPWKGGIAERQPEHSLFFVSGSAELSAEAKAKLDALAPSMRARASGHRILVQGFADASGDESANVELSERRAQAVAIYLAGRGVPRDRIETKGLGVRRPADREDTDSALARDRCVELWVEP